MEIELQDQIQAEKRKKYTKDQFDERVVDFDSQIPSHYDPIVHWKQLEEGGELYVTVRHIGREDITLLKIKQISNKEVFVQVSDRYEHFIQLPKFNTTYLIDSFNWHQTVINKVQEVIENDSIYQQFQPIIEELLKQSQGIARAVYDKTMMLSGYYSSITVSFREREMRIKLTVIDARDDEVEIVTYRVVQASQIEGILHDFERINKLQEAYNQHVKELENNYIESMINQFG